MFHSLSRWYPFSPRPTFLGVNSGKELLPYLFTFVDMKTLQTLSFVCWTYRRVIFTTNELFPKIIRAMSLIDAFYLQRRECRNAEWIAYFWPSNTMHTRRKFLEMECMDAKMDCSRMLFSFWEDRNIELFVDFCDRVMSPLDASARASTLYRYIFRCIEERRFELLFQLHQRYDTSKFNDPTISQEICKQFFSSDQFNFWEKESIDLLKWNPLFKDSTLAADNWIGYCQFCLAQEEWLKKIPKIHFEKLVTSLAEKIYVQPCDPLLVADSLQKKCEVIASTEDLFAMFDRYLLPARSTLYDYYRQDHEAALQKNFFHAVCVNYGIIRR